MAKGPFNQGDSAEASRLNYGLRSDGSVLLPGNKYFRDQSKLVQFLRKNPGYVYKNRQFIRSIAGGRFFSLAGYHIASDGIRMAQYEGVPGAGQGKQIRFWTDDANEASHLQQSAEKPQVIKTSDGASAPPPKKGQPKPSAPSGIGEHDYPVARPLDPASQPAKTPPAKRKSSSGVQAGGNPISFADPGTAAALTTLLKQAQKLAGQRLTPTLSPSTLDQYLKNDDPLKSSQTAANLAYDAQISALNRQLGNLSDGAISGVFSDLDKFWGMLGTENANAKASDQAQLEANSKALNDAAQGFMGAVGGSAEPGAASIGQQAVISDAGLKAMGTANTNFDTNIGNFFAQAGAGQKAQIAGDISNQRADLAAQLSDIQREKGMYQSQAFENLSNENADTKLSLLDTLFNQRQQISDDAWNRTLGLGNLIGQASLLPGQITQGNINNAQGVEDWKRTIILNAQDRARLKQFQSQQGDDQFPFSQLDPGTRAKLASQLQQNLLGPMGKLTVNPKQFLSTLRNRLYNTAGYSQSPQTEQYIMSLLTPQLISWWNKYHPKHVYTG